MCEGGGGGGVVSPKMLWTISSSAHDICGNNDARAPLFICKSAKFGHRDGKQYRVGCGRRQSPFMFSIGGAVAPPTPLPMETTLVLAKISNSCYEVQSCEFSS